MSDSNQKDLFDSSENSSSKEEKNVTKKLVTKKKVKSTKQTGKTKLKTQEAHANANQNVKDEAEVKLRFEEKAKIFEEMKDITAKMTAAGKKVKADEAAKVAQAKADQEKADEAAKVAQAKADQEKADEAAKVAQAKADQEKADEAAKVAQAKADQEKADEAAKVAQAKADQEKADEAAKVAQAKADQEKADEAAKVAQAKADQEKADEAAKVAQAKADQEKADEAAKVAQAKADQEKADEAAKVAQAKADQEKADEAAKVAQAKADQEKADEAAKVAQAKADQEKADEAAKVAQAKADQEKADEAAKVAQAKADQEKADEAAKELDESNETDASNITETSKKEDRFLVLTHRRNLLSIMSSGLIGPKQIYGKYRDDILVKTKDLLPLFSRSVSGQLIDLTTSNRDSNFPVILELDKEKIPDSFNFGVNSKGELVKNVNKSDSLLFRLTKDILSTNMIKEVHFISEENLTDFRDRMFDNVPIHDFSLAESPKIFDSTSSFPIEFFDVISNLEFEANGQAQVNSSPRLKMEEADDLPFGPDVDKPSAIPELNDNIERIARISDKVAASVALLSENMERGSDLKLLHALLSFPYKGNNSRMADSYNTFAKLISSLVVGDGEIKSQTSEYYLLSATLEELIYHSPNEGWVALDFLEKIESRFITLNQGLGDNFDSYFEACKKILNSEMDIHEGQFSDEKNIVQRAVMLFLLRPDYDDLIGKENSQLNPGSFVKKIAILITGFRVGYERISTQFKGLHHQIFAPLRAYIVNYGLGNISENFEKKPKAIVDWNPDERIYTFKYRLLKETITGELSIRSYIHDVIQKMLDQDHIHDDFEILGGTLDYRFEYFESGSERKQPVNLDFDSVKDNLIISSPCFEIIADSHKKRITKVILQKIFAEDYDGKAYWIYEKNKSITLKRVIHHDEIASIDIVDLINFIAKTADEVEEKYFKQDKVR